MITRLRFKYLKKNKLLSFALCLLLQMQVVQAQQKEKNHTLYITGGTISRYNFKLTTVNNFFEIFFSSFFGTTPQMQHGSQPLICIGYQYKAVKNFRAGIEVIRDRFWLGSKDNYYTFHSLLLRGDYVWLNTKHIDMYTGGGVGISTAKNIYSYNNTIKKEKNTSFGWQLYTVGMDYKLNSITLCGNIGYGAAGFVNGGIKYSF